LWLLVFGCGRGLPSAVTALLRLLLALGSVAAAPLDLGLSESASPTQAHGEDRVGSAGVAESGGGGGHAAS
jgi:hypothetical protein